MRYRFFFLQHSIILDSDPTCQLSGKSCCLIQFRWRDVLYQQLEKIEEALGGNFGWIHRSERFKVVALHLVTCGRLQLQKVLEELSSKMEQHLSVFLVPSVPTCPLILMMRNKVWSLFSLLGQWTKGSLGWIRLVLIRDRQFKRVSRLRTFFNRFWHKSNWSTKHFWLTSGAAQWPQS